MNDTIPTREQLTTDAAKMLTHIIEAGDGLEPARVALALSMATAAVLAAHARPGHEVEARDVFVRMLDRSLAAMTSEPVS